MKAIERLIGKKVIVRSYGAGVFYGTLGEAEPTEDVWTVELRQVRRLWYWEGAASLTQLAMEGTKVPKNCKFTLTEDSIVVAGVIELHECAAVAVESIEAVADWKR